MFLEELLELFGEYVEKREGISTTGADNDVDDEGFDVAEDAGVNFSDELCMTVAI